MFTNGRRKITRPQRVVKENFGEMREKMKAKRIPIGEEKDAIGEEKDEIVKKTDRHRNEKYYKFSQ